MNIPKSVIDFVKGLVNDEQPAFAFEAGKECPVQCARSGSFIDMGGQKVEFTTKDLSALASAFNTEVDHKLKIGHVPIRSDTPDFGDVTRLSYDEGKDRLLAHIVPTPVTVEKNRKEGFRRVSMELEKKDGKFDFTHLALLGARRPAISGLDPVSLAGAGDDGVYYLSAEGPDDGVEEPKRKEPPTESNEEHARTDPPEEKKPEQKLSTLDIGPTVSPDETKTRRDGDMDEKQVARLARLEKQVNDGARDRAKAFLAANVKRIHLKLVAGGLEDRLTALLTADAMEPATFEFSEGDKKVSQTASEILMWVLSTLPEQVTSTETAELAKDGSEDDAAVELAEFAGADEESIKYHAKVVRTIASAKANGQELSYLEGVQIVERASRGSR